MPENSRRIVRVCVRVRSWRVREKESRPKVIKIIRDYLRIIFVYIYRIFRGFFIYKKKQYFTRARRCPPGLTPTEQQTSPPLHSNRGPEDLTNKQQERPVRLLGAG